MPWNRVFSQLFMSCGFRAECGGGIYFVHLMVIITSLWCVLSLCAKRFAHGDGLVDLSSSWVAVGAGEQLAVLGVAIPCSIM